ncbi:hypothetical protein ACFRCI_03430 [Streptomyces sp. NPDC056638]|uniref:hypothetical protein n=1 Tax=Streptomyces sp. NPDC056638 TaxID=3345887 RepID=UPI0036A14D41
MTSPNVLTTPCPLEANPVDATIRLDSVLRAAGITLPELQPQTGGSVSLGSVIAATATALTQALREGLTKEYEAADAVRDAARSAGLKLEPPRVFRRRVHLGVIDMETVQHLDVLLSPAAGDADAVEEPEEIAARLILRLREVTDGGFLDAEFYGRCPRCGGDEHIQLESITPDQALAFARSLAPVAS